MADPLLTSLCGICHIKEPKYKCPRCGVRTCSLTCSKKHKSWSSCNGERDPTVYVPPTRLRTDAGIDHDYNFLTKIERTMERTERMFIEDKGILPEPQARPHPNKRHKMHHGHSQDRTTTATAESDARRWAKLGKWKLTKLDINLKLLPFGMERARENTTSYNRRTKAINWQVEWLLVDSEQPSEESRHGLTRSLNKAPDLRPLHLAFADCQEANRRLKLSNAEKEAEKLQAKKERALTRNSGGSCPQDTISGAWIAAIAVKQDPTTGSWQTSAGTDKTLEVELEKRHDQWKFFVQIPGTPSKDSRKLVSVDATETLDNALRGLDVLEFPTLLVLPSHLTLPTGYTIMPRPKNQHGGRLDALAQETRKRKRFGVIHGVLAEEEENGEIRDDKGLHEGQPESEAENEEHDEGATSVMRGENCDDTTSSSGSDSDSDLDMDED
jgi:hypothetical protein